MPTDLINGTLVFILENTLEY